MEEMHQGLVYNHNLRVGPSDTTYFLGDFSFRGNPKHVEMTLSKMNGKKYLIPGGHDQPKKWFHFFHILPMIWDVSDGKNVFTCCHLPLETWPKKRFGAIHLHAHIHGKWPFKLESRKMDVGVDTNNLFPYSFDEILKKFEGEKI